MKLFISSGVSHLIKYEWEQIQSLIYKNKILCDKIPVFFEGTFRTLLNTNLFCRTNKPQTPCLFFKLYQPLTKNLK